MIVDNFCSQAQDGLTINKKMGDIRRNPGYEEPKIDITRVSQTSDVETARQVEKVVNEQMKSGLARIEHLSPRGVQGDYENINQILDELDS